MPQQFISNILEKVVLVNKLSNIISDVILPYIEEAEE